MFWPETQLKIADGSFVKARAPVIISASRATDIPAFYSGWLINRIKQGYLKWKNRFNGEVCYVSLASARLMVFWSKNPKPLIEHLDFFDERKMNYYFQYTLNDYDAENLEPHVPPLDSRIETFMELSEKTGRDKVIWRFDPLILTDKMGVDELLRKAENAGDKLKDHTSKMVFSFADIGPYKKVQHNLQHHAVRYLEFDEKAMNEFAAGLQQLNKRWNFEIGSCAEKLPLEQYGIIHNKCIDDDLIIRLFNADKVLMDFLNVKIIAPDLLNPETCIVKQKNNKDKGQRKYCGCIVSKDIGEYNTCPHLCRYCYANDNAEKARKGYQKHLSNTTSETISGE
ncbi:MAG TPA: DUF1848 domain-containing protein [Bacteroidales bacterium]|mgnify:CR=1 FL=1|nr:DUF1848 domain-containing protein [Bacteroidales bacterium]